MKVAESRKQGTENRSFPSFYRRISVLSVFALLSALVVGCSSSEEPARRSETASADQAKPIQGPIAAPPPLPTFQPPAAVVKRASAESAPESLKPLLPEPSASVVVPSPKDSANLPSEPAPEQPPRLLPTDSPPTKPGGEKSYVTKAEVLKAEKPKSEVPKVETPKLETLKPVLTTPDTPKPETAKPETPQSAEARRNPLRDGSEPPEKVVPNQDGWRPSRTPAPGVSGAAPAKPAAGPKLEAGPDSGGPAAKQVAPGKTEISIQPATPAVPPQTGGPPAHSPEPSGNVPQTGKHSGVAFDPVKENGPIFVDWPKPKLALVITGRQDGYMEPCGCAGLERMKGGMSRRHTLFRTLRDYGWRFPAKGSKDQGSAPTPGDQGWPTVGLDVGGIAKGFGRQPELKFQFMIEGMRKMGYGAIGLGWADLQLPTGEVLADTAPVNNQPSPFVSANVGLFVFDESTLAQTRIITSGEKRVGVTSVLGKGYQNRINNASVLMVDPETALAKMVPVLKKNAETLVLLAHASKEESIALARQFPDFDFVVTAGGPAEPPAQPEKIKGGKTWLIEVGEKGMYAVVLGLFDDPRQPVRYQRVPLDSRFDSSRDMLTIMAVYQDQLKRLGLEGLGIRPLPHPLAEVNGRFVGNEKCKACHEESYRVWKKSGHAKAYASLIQAAPPRNFDPECVSCHVVGWHPTKFFPYKSGYLSIQETPKLINVGCEDCHGPGENHLAAEANGDTVARDKLRKAMALTKEEASDPNSKRQNCYSCHDGDNSPEFDFKRYWPHVEHHEKE